MRFALFCAMALLAGCDRDAALGEAPGQAASAAARPLALQDITMADIDKYDLSGMGCVFVPQGRKEAAALLEDLEAQLKIGGALVRLPAGKGSRELDYGTRSNYSDGKLTLEIAPGPGRARSTGPESQEQPATLTIRDGAGREVYRAPGVYECAA